MGALNHTTNLEKMKQELECPVYFEPLIDAVSLIPCSHKVGELAAKELFGKTTEDWKVTSNEKCPLCEKVVIGYSPDHTVRNTASLIVNSSQKDEQNLKQELKVKIPDQSLAVQAPKLSPLPYPGKSAKLKHTSGDWSYFDHGPPLCRRLDFKSIIDGSTVQEVSFLGYKDNSVSLHVHFSESDKVSKYLKSYELLPDSQSYTALSHMTYTHKDTKTLFAILAENNSFPDTHYGMMKEIIEKGYWE
ncbi:MAG: hypothetical protein AAGG81_00810 [Chlamydiota bacterium]